MSGFRPTDLLKFPRREQIPKLRARLLYLPHGLIASGRIGGIVLREQQLAISDLVATRDRHTGEQPLLGGPP